MSDEDDQEPTAPTPGWARVLVVTAAVLAVLLVGAAAGLLIAQSRTSETAAPSPDSVATGFCQDMSVHHRQAIYMAGLARDRTTDEAIKHVAFDIETGQTEQVGRMQGWLNLWGRDPLPIGGYMGWMTGSTHAHTGPVSADGKVATMPGVATPDELKELDRLTGAAFDLRFLQLMLRHHQGGVEMLRYAAERAEVGVVRNLASQMAVAQTNESDLLLSMITQRGGTPLPSPNE